MTPNIKHLYMTVSWSDETPATWDKANQASSLAQAHIDKQSTRRFFWENLNQRFQMNDYPVLRRWLFEKINAGSILEMEPATVEGFTLGFRVSVGLREELDAVLLEEAKASAKRLEQYWLFRALNAVMLFFASRDKHPKMYEDFDIERVNAMFQDLYINVLTYLLSESAIILDGFMSTNDSLKFKLRSTANNNWQVDLTGYLDSVQDEANDAVLIA